VELTFKTKNARQLEASKLYSDDLTEEVLYGGSKGSGKSYLGCSLIFGDALIYPETHYFIARKELTDLRKFTIPSIHEVFSNWGLKIEDYAKFNGQDNCYNLYNKSKVYLIACKEEPSDPMFERFGSMQMTRGWIEEGGEVAEAAKDNLSLSIGRWKNEQYGLKRKLLITCNPKKGWMKRDFIEPYNRKELPPHRKFVPARATDNKYLPAGYVKTLSEIKDTATRERLYLGNWDYDEDQNALVTFDDLCDAFSNTPTKDGSKYLIIDVARFGKDFTTYNFWDGLELYKVEKYNKQDTYQTIVRAKDLASAHKIPYSHILVDEDGIGCLVKGTEVFTTNGWKKVEDITIDDKVFSQNRKGRVIEAGIHKNIIHNKVEITKLTNGYVFSSTHWLPYKVRKEYKFNVNIWGNAIKKDRIILKNDFNWKGKNSKFVLDEVTLEMPNGGVKKCSPRMVIDSIQFAQFLGWFVSEGSLDGKYILISQSQKSDNLQDIKDAISSCGLHYTSKISKVGEVTFSVCNKNLKNWLKENCYTSNRHIAVNKKVPQWLKESDKETIRTFLESFRDGDGYIKKEGNNCYVTSSKILSDDILELIYKSGGYGNKYIKQVAGSTGKIGDRIITRTVDNYCVFEYKNKNIGLRPEVEKIYFDDVYDIGVSSETKLYMVRFADKKAFWVHNGAVVDGMRGVRGFIANSRALPTETEIRGRLSRIESHLIPKTNYANLKAQCAYKLAEMITEHEIAFRVPEYRNEIVEDLTALLRQKDKDDEGKLKIVPKDEVKASIIRSPDIGDPIIMRMWFELNASASSSAPRTEAMANKQRERMASNKIKLLADSTR